MAWPSHFGLWRKLRVNLVILAPKGEKPQIFSQGQVAHIYFLLSWWKTTLFLSKTTKKVMCTLWPSEILYLENWLRCQKAKFPHPLISKANACTWLFLHFLTVSNIYVNFHQKNSCALIGLSQKKSSNIKKNGNLRFWNLTMWRFHHAPAENITF